MGVSIQALLPNQFSVIGVLTANTADHLVKGANDIMMAKFPSADRLGILTTVF